MGLIFIILGCIILCLKDTINECIVDSRDRKQEIELCKKYNKWD